MFVCTQTFSYKQAACFHFLLYYSSEILVTYGTCPKHILPNTEKSFAGAMAYGWIKHPECRGAGGHGTTSLGQPAAEQSPAKQYQQVTFT